MRLFSIFPLLLLLLFSCQGEKKIPVKRPRSTRRVQKKRPQNPKVPIEEIATREGFGKWNFAVKGDVRGLLSSPLEKPH